MRHMTGPAGILEQGLASPPMPEDGAAAAGIEQAPLGFHREGGHALKRAADAGTEVSWPSKRVPNHYVEGFGGPEARFSDANRAVRPADGAVVGNNPHPGQAFVGADDALPFRDAVFSDAQSYTREPPHQPLPLPSSIRAPDWSAQPMPPRRNEPAYSETSTSNGHGLHPCYPQAVFQPRQNERSVSSPGHRRPSAHDSWSGDRDASDGRGTPQQAAPVNTGGLDAVIGVDGSIGPGQGLRARASVFSRQHQPLDNRLTDGTEFSGQPGTMVPLPGDGYEGNLGFPSHVGHGGEPAPEPSTHGGNIQSLMSPPAALTPRFGQGMSSVRSSFSHGHSHQDQTSQDGYLGSATPEQYIPPNTALSAAGNMEMALYPTALHAHTAAGQASTSLEAPYPHTSGASVQPQLLNFPAAAHPTGPDGHVQTIEAGYACSFPPPRAPHFGLETAPQYAMPTSSPLNPMVHHTSMPPPSFGPPRLSRYFATSDPPHHQQARTERHVGEQDESRHRERKRRQSKSPKTEDLSEEQSSDSGGADERALSVQNSKKPRARFSEEARAETGATRRTGACIRCRIQRSRCMADPDDPSGECRTCKAVRKESRKVVHRLPCLRYKMTEITVSRMDDATGALQLTKRWQGFDVKDIGDWVTADVREIELSLSVCPAPIKIRVRKFRPVSGDVTHRCWRDGNVTKKADIEPYALASVRQSAKDVVAYLHENTAKTLVALSEDGSMSGITRETYRWAIQHYNALRVPELSDSQQREEWLFLTDVYRLWMAVRYAVGSSYVSGDDRLDMEPKLDDKSYPLWGRVSTPRMIVAQIDSINAEIVAPLRRKVLRTLEGMIKANKTQQWFTIYIAVFLLLHNVSTISADRRRHGKANGATKGYSLPRFVEDLHEGANILLAHWHYYRTDEDPLEVDVIDKHRSRLQDLGAEQFSFVKKSCSVMRERREEFRRHPNWDDEVYWVCRMFDKDWSPGESFRS